MTRTQRPPTTDARVVPLGGATQVQGGGTAVSVAIAEGVHPVPSRTRKLSPPAPMVLPWRRGGRVGRRRDLFAQEPPSGGSLRFGTLRRMASTRRPRPVPRARMEFDLPRGVLGELRQTAKPGRADDAAAHLERAVAALESGDAGGAAREAERAKSLAARSPVAREIL